MTKKLLIVVADTNDGDYITCISPITDEKLESFSKLINAIKQNGSYNWSTSEYSDEPRPKEMYSEFGGVVDDFGFYVPHGEYGVHTIDSIRVVECVSDLELLR